MADPMTEVLKHQYIYVPHVKDALDLGKQLALAVARAHGTPLRVLAPQKNSATFHPELTKLEIITERSGYLDDGGVILAWCPTHKAMEKTHHLHNSIIVLVEWIPGEFATWAKLHDAYNITTGHVMTAGLSAAARKALEMIVSEGYNGWTKPTDQLMTTSYLEDLRSAGAYDRDLVLAFARQTKWETSIERLKKIIDTFEGKTATSPRRRG